MAVQPYTDVSAKMTGFDTTGTQYGYIVTDGTTDTDGRNLKPGEALVTPDGAYTLFFQTDGNLVLYRGNDFTVEWPKALWSSQVYFPSDTPELVTNSILGTSHGRLQTLQVNADGTTTQLWETGEHDLDVTDNRNGDAILLLLQNNGAWGQATSSSPGTFDDYNTWNVSSDQFSPNADDPLSGYQFSDIDLDVDHAVITSEKTISSLLLYPTNDTDRETSEKVTLSLAYTYSYNYTLAFQEGLNVQFTGGETYETAGPVKDETSIQIQITGSFQATETSQTSYSTTQTFSIQQTIEEAPYSSYEAYLTADAVDFQVPMSYNGPGIYRSGAVANIASGNGLYDGQDATDFTVVVDGPFPIDGTGAEPGGPVRTPIDPEDGTFFTFVGASEELVRQHVLHDTIDIDGKSYALVEHTADWGTVENLMLNEEELGSRAATDWAIANFVDVRASFVKAATGADVKILGLQRGEIVTGIGNDRVQVAVMSDEGSSCNTTAIETGDGADDVLVSTVRATRLEDRLLRDNDDPANGPLWDPTYGGCFSNAVVDLGAGDDTVRVRNKISTEVLGGEGDDRITGGWAADLIDGGPGADRMEGRGGDDIFVLRPGEVGGDVIVDFAGAGQDGGDFLRLEGFEAGEITALGDGRFRLGHLVGDGVSPPAVVQEIFELFGVTSLAANDYTFV